MEHPQAGEVRLLALRNSPKVYEIFPSTEAEEAIGFLMQGGSGGVIYKFEYVHDKNGDVIPKCERLGVV